MPFVYSKFFYLFHNALSQDNALISDEEKGVLIWCDDQGVGIKTNDLKKMKHSGKAYLKVVGVNRLPTVYELTEDPGWVVGGELYQFYNLELDSGDELLSAGVGDDADLNTLDDSEIVNNSGDGDGVDEGIKVFNHRTNEEVKEIVRESIQKQREEYVADDPEIVKLTDELGDILEPYVSEDDEEEPVEVNNHQFQMVDIFPGDPGF